MRRPRRRLARFGLALAGVAVVVAAAHATVGLVEDEHDRAGPVRSEAGR